MSSSLFNRINQIDEADPVGPLARDYSGTFESTFIKAAIAPSQYATYAPIPSQQNGIVKSYPFTSMFTLTDGDWLIYYYPQSGRREIGVLFKSSPAAISGFDLVSVLNCPADLSQFHSGLLTTSVCSIYSNTISTTNANLSGSITSIVCKGVPDVPINYNTLPTLAMDSAACAANIPLSEGVSMLSEPNWNGTLIPQRGTYSNVLKYDFATEAVPLITYEFPDLGFSAPTVIDFRDEPSPFHRGSLGIRLSDDSDLHVAYQLDLEVRGPAGARHMEGLYFQSSIFFPAAYDEEWCTLTLTLRVQEPRDDLMAGVVILTASLVAPPGPPPTVVLQCYSATPLFKNNSDARHLTWVAGNSGSKAFNFVGTLNYQMVLDIKDYTKANMIRFDRCTLEPLDVYRMLLAHSADTGVNLVYTRSQYLHIAHELANFWGNMSNISGLMATHGYASVWSWIKDKAEQIKPYVRKGLDIAKQFGYTPEKLITSTVPGPIGSRLGSLAQQGLESHGYASIPIQWIGSQRRRGQEYDTDQFEPRGGY